MLCNILVMTHALRLFRTSSDLTLDALADQVGVTKGQLSKIETGKALPSVSLIQRLIAASGGQLSADDFLAPLPRQTAADAGIPCAQNDAAASAALSINPEAERLSAGE